MGPVPVAALTPEQYEHIRERIELFARLELIALAITTAVHTVTAAKALEELQSSGTGGYGRLPTVACRFWVTRYD